MFQQTHDVNPLVCLVLHALVDKVLSEIITVVQPLQFHVVLNLVLVVEGTVSGDETVHQAANSPNCSGKSGVSLFSVVFGREIDICSLVGGVGVWSKFAGGAEVKNLYLECGWVEEYVLVFDVSVVDTARDKIVYNLIRSSGLGL